MSNHTDTVTSVQLHQYSTCVCSHLGEVYYAVPQTKLVRYHEILFLLLVKSGLNIPPRYYQFKLKKNKLNVFLKNDEYVQIST